MKQLLLITLAAMLISVGCAKEIDVTRCDDGSYCQSGTKCVIDVSSVDEVRYKCTNAGCGNGQLEIETEACDEGQYNSDLPNAGCRTDCTYKDCGDGIDDDLEECDDGLENTFIAEGLNMLPDRCRAILNPDYNPANPLSSPVHLCRLPWCGDGIKDSDEDCDDGDDDNSNTCRITCELAQCGDGIINMSVPTNDSTNVLEQCDDGELNSDEPNGCRVGTCLLPFCGDGTPDD
ncbi:hypothetical protein KKF84_04625, partial [Myxococcota bacterium]|nr:hypothetical protein [Myxococcota bacterium]